MTFREPYIPNRQGAIDSVNAITDGAPFDADTLRVIAGQANRQRIEPSVITNVAVDVTDDPETGRPFKIAATEDWRLLLPLRGPRRPIFDQARIAMALFVEVANNIEFGFVCPPLPLQSVGVVQGQAGLIRETPTIRLPQGLSEQSVLVYVRGVGDGALANATTIGGPNTVAIDYTTSVTPRAVVGPFAVSIDQAYTVAEVGNGTYSARAVDPSGTILWQRRIISAALDNYLVAPPANGTTLTFESRLSTLEQSNTGPGISGINVEIRDWTGRASLAGLTVLGEVA